MSAQQFHSREAMAAHVLGRVAVAAKRHPRVRALRGPDSQLAVIHGTYARLMDPGDLIEQLTPAKRKKMLKPVLSVGNVQLCPIDSPRWRALEKFYRLLFELSPFWNSRQQDKLIEQAVDAERQAFKRSTTRSSKPSAPPTGDPADLERHTAAHQLHEDTRAQSFYDLRKKKQHGGDGGRRQYSDYAFITGQEKPLRETREDRVRAAHRQRLKDLKNKAISESVIKTLADKFGMALQQVIDSAAIREALFRAEIHSLRQALLTAQLSAENVEAFVSKAEPLCEVIGVDTDAMLSNTIEKHPERRPNDLLQLFKLYWGPEEEDAA